MNCGRWLAALVVLSGLVATARAEDGKKETADLGKQLLGTWEVVKADEGTLPPKTTVEFAKDGKIKFAGKQGDQDLMFDGTYKVEAKAFIFTMKRGEDERMMKITVDSISDKEMAVTDMQGKKVSFKRVK